MGAAMGNAGRDPIFWATLAIAEQDFDGAGDLCIRCHSSGGWIGGRSTPTDASGLRASDENGIDCDTCHQMTNPDVGEHVGIMVDPFIANSADSLTPVTGLEAYYGSGIYVLSNDFGKLGPYAPWDAVARHQMSESDFHRDVDFCGTCHDVSNSAVGQLAPNAGAQPGAPAVIRSGELGYHQILNPNVTPHVPATLGGTQQSNGMAAFENPPYAYGIVERTYSEYKSSPFGTDDQNARILVDEFYTKLPADLQDPRGSLYFSYMAATSGETRSANYVDHATNPDATSLRYFSCQTCHMRAITGRGCDKNNAPNRLDQPMHDQTGGNYWVYPLIQYQDQQGTLRLGGGLTADQIAAMDDGTLRASEHLTQAATLDVNGNKVRITNMTGHKLISGYPEGRRMWLNIKWYDVSNPIPGVTIPIREDGAYGPLLPEGQFLEYTDVNGDTHLFNPKSILDLAGTNTRIYEVHPAMTQEWAHFLVNTANYPADMPLSFDRLTGLPDFTLGQLAAQAPGTYHKTFHFVLNNYVASDNRIPPYQMSYDEAKKRNALPVPEDQYGNPGPGGAYQHWDEFDISKNAPAHAKSAKLTLYYQGTSWEYVQFLNNAVSTTLTGAGAPYPVTPFLADEGKNYLDANQKMVPPYPMATALWEAECVPNPDGEICDNATDDTCDGLIDCNDPLCNGDPACPDLIEWPHCFDGLDNDFDGLTDCADRTDCDGEIGTSSCGAGVCASTGSQTCRNGTPEDNGLDNDCDGFTDTADPDCDICPNYNGDRRACRNAGCNYSRRTGLCTAP
jgi:hypothetical protein